MQGLNLINSTNLDYFQPQHQAEMINLKAQFFAALGDGEAGEFKSIAAVVLQEQRCWGAALWKQAPQTNSSLPPV
jgi:hypothetical protein